MPVRVAAFALLVPVLSGCGRSPPDGSGARSCVPRSAPPRPAPAPPAQAAARSGTDAIGAAEADLRHDETVPATASFRGVTAWTQAMPGRTAVCGQTNPFPSDPAIFVPFVSVMSEGKPAPVDRFVGRTPDDADRVYEAITGYCFERGGPVPALQASPLPIPPLPNDAAPPADATSAPTTLPPAPSPAATHGPGSPAPPTAPPPANVAPVGGEVTMRQDGNLHQAPHGLTVRVLPAGTVLHVFATAPGGWLEVGETAPEGWMHQSMVAP